MDPVAPQAAEARRTLTEVAATWLTPEMGLVAVRVFLLVVVGWALAGLLRRAGGRVARGVGREDVAPLVEKVVFYVVVGLVIASVLRELGFDLSVLLGAAGVVTVAVGFAAQTSMANLISGLFLVLERAFQIGDVIRVGQTTGEVVEIDWLSVKLRTFDNLLVRVPNETLVKTEITNLSRFPIRRYDLVVDVAYNADLEHVRATLLQVAEDDPVALEEPAPIIVVRSFAESGVRLQFSVWAQRSNWLELGNRMHEEVKKAFDREGIEIPYPHRVLVAREPVGSPRES